MKAHLTKVSLALLSVAFLFGCQDQGSEPLGLDAAGPQFAKGGKKGAGAGKVPADIMVTGGLVTEPDTQVVGFKDMRKEIELESAGSDPKIKLHIG